MRHAATTAAAVILLAGCGVADQSQDAAPEPTADVETEAVEEIRRQVRFATFNVHLNRPTEGALAQDLALPDNVQAKKVAEIIQRTAPDILLLNEFDYDAGGESLKLFRENYLEISQNGADPIVYPYAYAAPSNTGLHSGHDLNRDGEIVSQAGSVAYGNDAFGFGEFPGQYAMALLSKYPIDEANIRTFQLFRWQDMPGALLPDDTATPEPNDWYSAAALEEFRLSSKSHWDVPVMIGEETVHVLAAHPTPPSFDGEEDRNGKRNFDELRLLADYISPTAMSYIYDDNGAPAGLADDARFVIMGDLNADPFDGGSVPGAIDQLLFAPRVSQAPSPQSAGGDIQSELQAGANLTQNGPPSEDTADFNDDPERGVGNLHLDYVLFSNAGFEEAESGIFWPTEDEPHYDLVGPGFPLESSDHRLVWRDLVVTPIE